MSLSGRDYSTTTSVNLLESMQGTAGGEAWDEFHSRYAGLLLAVGRRFGLSSADAQDAVQDTLLAVLREFRALKKPYGFGCGRFRAWLRAVAIHKVQDIRRRQMRQQRATSAKSEELEMGMEPWASGAGAERIFEEEWQRNIAARAMEQVAREMDPDVIQAFQLYAVNGHSVAKVAHLLGVTRNAVYICKSRVLARLRRVVRDLQKAEDEA